MAQNIPTIQELKDDLDAIKQLIETSNPDPRHRPNRFYTFNQDLLNYIEATAANIPTLGGQGWAYYTDSQYTAASPRTISGGARTQLTIDALGSETNESYRPPGTSTWWNTTTNRFMPSNLGDAYNLRFNLTADASGSNPYLTLELDINGTIGVVWANTFFFARGAGVDTKFAVTIPVFTLDTFMTNGAAFYVTSSTTTTIHSAKLLIQRSFEAVQ